MKTREIVVGEAYAWSNEKRDRAKITRSKRVVVLRKGVRGRVWSGWREVASAHANYIEVRVDGVHGSGVCALRPVEMWAPWGECERLRRELKANEDEAVRDLKARRSEFDDLVSRLPGAVDGRVGQRYGLFRVSLDADDLRKILAATEAHG